MLRPGGVIEHPWMRFIGRISYRVDLWQQLYFVASFLERALLQRFPLNPLLWPVAFGTCVTRRARA